MNYYILFFVIILAIAAIYFFAFIKQPRDIQLQQLQQWLVYATAQAEKQLGSGQGQLKLRMVFDEFLQKFPHLAPYIAFDYFSELVDAALEKLRSMLEQNEKLQEYVGSDEI